jgi:hypothetical protein
MKAIITFLSLLGLFFSVAGYSAFAQSASPDMVEVNAQNKPSCVEYFIVNGKMFCSTKTTLPNNLADNHSDPLNLKFDQRPWVKAWRNDTPQIITTEYTVKGDDIKNWKELVTSQFLPGANKHPGTTKAYVENTISHLNKIVPGIKTQYLSESPNDITFMFQITEPTTMAQTEIQRAFTTTKGLYVVHYAIKSHTLNAQKQQQWVTLLKGAIPKANP